MDMSEFVIDLFVPVISGSGTQLVPSRETATPVAPTAAK
jgi:hypothetical protein